MPKINRSQRPDLKNVSSIEWNSIIQEWKRIDRRQGMAGSGRRPGQGGRSRAIKKRVNDEWTSRFRIRSVRADWLSDAKTSKLTLISLLTSSAMHTVNIHEAKTHLSRLVDEAARGEAFIIAKAGKPLVKVVPLDATEIGTHRRLGFMKGEISVPDDFDQMGAETVERLFQDDEP
jgi:prevent-host-death family protein